MIRVDMHMHTSASWDSRLSFDQLIAKAKSAGLDVVFITEHNKFGSAFELSKIAPFKVIPGEEIKSSAGEIIGLFLKEYIPPHLSPKETISRIKAQGGLVYVPHPFCTLAMEKLKLSALKEIMHLIDIIEVLNARDPIAGDDKKAFSLAVTHNKLMGGGTDAHLPSEVGIGYVEMEEFDGPSDFLEKLKSAKIVLKKRNHIFNLVLSSCNMLGYLLKGGKWGK